MPEAVVRCMGWRVSEPRALACIGCLNSFGGIIRAGPRTYLHIETEPRALVCGMFVSNVLVLRCLSGAEAAIRWCRTASELPGVVVQGHVSGGFLAMQGGHLTRGY